MNSTLQRRTGIILTVILLAVIAAGLISDTANGSGLPQSLSTYWQPARAEAAQADFDVDSLAEILYLFDGDSKYARLKTRFIENFEKLSPESRNKVIQMYLGGKKEQPDKLLLMKGMSATASFFRGVEVAQNIIHEYQTTGVIKEDGDFIGLSLGYAIVECFPKSSVQLIPLLANPADVDKLIAMMGQAITDHNAKNRAEAEKNRAEAEKNRAEAEKNRAEAEQLDKKNQILDEINEMLRKALGK